MRFLTVSKPATLVSQKMTWILAHTQNIFDRDMQKKVLFVLWKYFQKTEKNTFLKM